MYHSAGFLLSSVCLSVSLLGEPVWGVTTADNPGIRTVFTTKAVEYCKANQVHDCMYTQEYALNWTSVIIELDQVY